MPTDQETQLEDHDPNLVEKALIPTLVTTAEGNVSKFLGHETHFENVGPAADGLYDAHKENIVPQAIRFGIDMMDVSIDEITYRISDGIITPEEQAALEEKIQRLQERYPEVTKRYSVEPVASGELGPSSTLEIINNINTLADPSEAFSMKATFNREVNELTLSFDKPVDVDGTRLDEKVTYALNVLEEMGADKETIAFIVQHHETSSQTKEFIDNLIDDTNRAIDGGVELTPALLCTEVKVLAEQEKAAESNANDIARNEVSDLGDKAPPPVADM